MTRFQALVVRGQRETAADQSPALLLGVSEMRSKKLSICKLEIVGREFHLRSLENLPIRDQGRSRSPVVVEIEDAFEPLDEHRQPFEAIGQLGRNRVTVDAADLLEIGELADLHAVEPDLPTQPPGTQCRTLPIVFDKADIVQGSIDPDRVQASEIERLAVRRRGLQDHLELVEMLQSIGVLPIAAVGRSAGGLNVGCAPRLWPECTQGRRWMKGAGPDFQIVGLQNHATLPRPKILQIENKGLKAQNGASLIA